MLLPIIVLLILLVWLIIGFGVIIYAYRTAEDDPETTRAVGPDRASEPPHEAIVGAPGYQEPD